MAQCRADVPGEIRILERSFRNAIPPDRDFIIDVLVPHYISTDLPDGAELLLSTEGVRPEMVLSRETLASVLRPQREQVGASQSLIDRVTAVHDDLLRGRWQQRLALGAYYAADFDAAIELALAAADAYQLCGSARGLAAAFSVLYIVHYAATGDVDRALHYASLQESAARRGGNESLGIAALVARYELSAEVGDAIAVSNLRRKLRQRDTPEQYRERFPRIVADALFAAWKGDFEVARSIVMILCGMTLLSEEPRLVTAMLSLFHLALGDSQSARMTARRALAHRSSTAGHIGAHHVRYNRVARALAAGTCLLINDTVRGRRIFETRALRFDAGCRSLRDVAVGADWETAYERMRGFARLLAMARDASPPSAHELLTDSEREILDAVAEGKMAAEIARESDRSVFTVRASIRTSIAKLNVSGRIAAVSRARRLGILK
jgi:ATP/maltotriose-dependent transcriptional regulator MalT